MRKLLSGICLLYPLLLLAQRATVCGYVSDAESGERLIGATVYDTVSHTGTVTNNAGFYSLTLPAGTHTLRAGYVGFNSAQQQSFNLQNDTLCHFRLTSATVIDEITVMGKQSVSHPMSVQMSAIEVPVSQIKSIPMIAGEVDVLKALQLLPGVQSGSEGSAGLYVRGGGPDENLILLDGVPLYNVNHLMGFFSVFNADAIKNVTLYKGNFPAQYGGRLSSIIDVRQNDGNAEGYHGNLTVGLLAAKFNIEGPIPHIKDSTGTTTFNISARRTYFDVFTTPIMGLVTAAMGSGTMGAGAYFYDVNAKLSHTFANQTDKLSASFYMGDDAVYMHMNYRDREISLRLFPRPPLCTLRQDEQTAVVQLLRCRSLRLIHLCPHATHSVCYASRCQRQVLLQHEFNSHHRFYRGECGGGEPGRVPQCCIHPRGKILQLRRACARLFQHAGEY